MQLVQPHLGLELVVHRGDHVDAVVRVVPAAAAAGLQAPGADVRVTAV
jgi:hypothetical protein